jgi:hypothetical protein
MKDEDIAKLTESEIKKIERVNESFRERADAEARLESQKKFRILFERAPEVTLPFIIYVIYMGSVALVILFKLIDFTGEQLYIGGILLFILIVAPLFVLPSESWKKLFKYLRSKLKRSKQG